MNVIFEEKIITASRVTSLLYGQTRLQTFLQSANRIEQILLLKRKLVLSVVKIIVGSIFSKIFVGSTFSKIFVMFFSSIQPENSQLVSFSR